MGKRRLQQVRDSYKEEPTLESTLDEIKIYDRVLSKQEIEMQFKEELCKEGQLQKIKDKAGDVIYCERNSKTGKLKPINEDDYKI